MLGYYNYTVILTYMSLGSAVSGIFLAVKGHPFWALVCLMISGLCDAFDGKVARTRKNSTEEEKRFGIQIDSLCDLVAFGILPCTIGYAMGMRSMWYAPVFIVYILAALIRLAYFNVAEEIRQQNTTETRKFYSGLPVTSASLLIPLVYGLIHLLDPFLWQYVFASALIIIAILFVCNFRLRKPGFKGIMILVGIGILEFLLIFGLMLLIRHGDFLIRHGGWR
ncbi:MAG: CDP-alcohol phosphatidyltransferase family protein [Clostridia bacterium]|nr:CDP-alcohol phosphatidyltransferase family protein [Clostridia bacterium]